MEHRKEIADELREISPELARLALIHPYQVPPGYFESLAELILLRIRTEEAGSAKEELEMISPFLSGLNKKMPFSTPAGYFENLAPKLPLPAENEHKGARVISISGTRRVFRLAVAAVTISVIALTAWFIIKQPQGLKDQYAMSSDSAVQKDLQNKVSELSEKEIVNFIEGGSTILNYESNSSGVDINEDDVKLMLADVSDQELEKYLDLNTQKEKFN